MTFIINGTMILNIDNVTAISKDTANHRRSLLIVDKNGCHHIITFDTIEARDAQYEYIVQSIHSMNYKHI